MRDNAQRRVYYQELTDDVESRTAQAEAYKVEYNGKNASCREMAVQQQVSNIWVCLWVEDLLVGQGLISEEQQQDINWLFVMVMCSSNVKAKHSEVNTEIDSHR